MLKIGLSSCGGKLKDDDFFKNCKNAGLSAVEISCSLEDFEELDFDLLKSKADKVGIELWSFHLPFLPFDKIDISSENENIRAQSVTLFKKYIKKGSDIGIKTFVVHPSIEPIEEAERAVRMASAQKSLCELAEYANGLGSVIAVENLPRTCLGRDCNDMAKLISANEKLKICYDTNHMLTCDPCDLPNIMGDKIATVHISDYDFVDEKHWLPGEGKVNWNKLYKALIDAGYKGPWMYEVNFAPEKALPRSRDLCCEDFLLNAREIFEGKKPSKVY